jgi:hypothetical protein
MPYLIFLLLAIDSAIVAIMPYKLDKDAWYFKFCMLGCCNCFTCMWLWVLSYVQLPQDENKLLFYTVLWDAIATLVGIGAIIVLCDVKLTTLAVIGTVITVIGLLILKMALAFSH